MAAEGYDPAKDFIDTQDYDRDEIEGLLDLIELLKGPTATVPARSCSRTSRWG